VHETSSIKIGFLYPSEKSLALVYGKFPTLDMLTALNLGFNDLQKTFAAVKLKLSSQIVPQ
jgi:hypothetical protein